jgi:DNA-directed RNA polymerase subunit N (RpoN/RPB10)
VVGVEADMLAMAFNGFTCSALVARHWERRCRRLEAGGELASAALAALVVAVAA